MTTDEMDALCPYCDGDGLIPLSCVEDTCCCEDPELEHGVMECPYCVEVK